jgi:hypothetical protein
MFFPAPKFPPAVGCVLPYNPRHQVRACAAGAITLYPGVAPLTLTSDNKY